MENSLLEALALQMKAQAEQNMEQLKALQSLLDSLAHIMGQLEQFVAESAKKQGNGHG